MGRSRCNREATLNTSTLPSGVDWCDAAALEQLDGPLIRYPVGKVLMLAHRTRGSGLIHIYDGDSSHRISLREGAVVQVQGIPGLLAELPVEAGAELDLLAAVELAARAGQPLPRVMDEAAKVVGSALTTWCLCETGMISVKLDVEPVGTPIKLPQSLVSMLSVGLQLAGSVEQAQKLLESQATDPVTALLPMRGDDGNLGLDALALRVVNLARSAPSLQDLVAHATRGNSARRREVLHRVTLLFKLGLLHLPEPPLGTEEETQRVPQRAPRVRRGGAAPEPPAAAPSAASAVDTGTFELTTEQQVERLRKRIIALQPKTFYQRLGLGDAPERPDIEAVEEAFRKLSRRHHPDSHIDSPPEVRAAATELFALLSEAVEGLRRGGRGVDEHWERTSCAQKGIPYVTDRDRTKAKMSFVKGERLMRNKDYAIAEACFHEATSRDPLNPQYAFMHAQAAHLARQMPAEEAIRIIDGLTPETQKQASQFQHVAGRILRLSGAPQEKCLERFQKAVELDPANRDAQRELRLQAMREEAKPAAPSPWSLSFLDRFRKKQGNGS
ncbi:MAG: J domain-containing protein [Pseudomonadota bacterium]